jgi:ABC-type antimicrobial peptide transport system permease subunit
MTTQSEQSLQSLAQERLSARLLSFFGGLALFLAAIGLTGVLGYSVAQRTNEIGIRMALGARAVDVSRMVLRETMIMTGIGMIIGLAVAIATTRFLESMLYGLTPTDVKVTSAAAVIMFIVAGLAGYIPSRRAASVDPMVALRQE